MPREPAVLVDRLQPVAAAASRASRPGSGRRLRYALPNRPSTAFWTREEARVPRWRGGWLNTSTASRGRRRRPAAGRRRGSSRPRGAARPRRPGSTACGSAAMSRMRRSMRPARPASRRELPGPGRRRRRPARGSWRARHPRAAARGAAHRRPHRPRARWPLDAARHDGVDHPLLGGTEPAPAVPPGHAAGEPVPEHPVAPTRVAAAGHLPSMDRPTPGCQAAARGGTRDAAPPTHGRSSSGGGRGIRTHDDVAAIAVFKTAALGHYASPPDPAWAGRGQGYAATRW